MSDTVRDHDPVAAEEPTPPTADPSRPRAGFVRRAVVLYVAWSLGALVFVSVIAAFLSTFLARQQALEDAEVAAEAVANQIVAPLSTPAFHAGVESARAEFGQALQARKRDGSILYVKVWADAGDGSGRVLWADEPAIVGHTFPMMPEDYALFRTMGSVARLSDLQRDENVGERGDRELVEVYTGFNDSSGRALIFEAYLPTAPLAAKYGSLISWLLPIMLGALAVLALVMLPLAISMARRIDQQQRDRELLLRHAVESSDLERRRIAQDLHDGVIQDLAGVSYALASLSRRVPEDEVSTSLLRASGTVQQDVASLRTLMTDIYPPDLESLGLAHAIEELVGQDAYGDTRVSLDIDEPLTPSAVTARLAFRVVRESLRNVVKHAQAHNVDVRLTQDDEWLVVQVRDDGVGFDSAAANTGGLGQKLLRDTVTDAGGTLDVVSVRDLGTLVTATLPL